MTPTEGQVEEILKQLDIEVTEEIGDELWAKCPNHFQRTKREDTHPSWSINRETGLFLCFSCKWRGNLYSLVRDLRSPQEARNLLRLRKTITGGYRPAAPTSRELDRGFVRPVRPVAKLRMMPESSLALYVDPPQWALDARRLDPAVTRRYGVLWDSAGEEWVLPLRDPHSNDLLGYQIKAQRRRLFRNHPPGLAKARTLFGYAAALDQERSDKRVVVVESPLDAVLVAGLGTPAVAVCGSMLSFEQLELLRVFDVVGLALDDDAAGRREMVRVNQVLRTGMASFRVPWLGSGKDFGEMEVDAVADCLEAGGLL